MVQASLRYRYLSLFSALLMALALFVVPLGTVEARWSSDEPGQYHNPLPIQIPGTNSKVESCADPTIIRGQTKGDNKWYMYCTTDPLNDNDKTGSNFNFHLIPMLESTDLVNWTYKGDAFKTRPSWAASDAGLWAPEIQYFNDKYYLYYAASWTSLPGGGSAIGVATGPTPLGPWTDSGGPVVEPTGPNPDARWWTFDPEVVTDQDTGQRYIFYGSYFGGIRARQLSADGMHSIPGTQKQITLDNRYEGPNIVKRGEYYYLFASATNCCNAALTGYSVFVGRSKTLLGPYVDRAGVRLDAPDGRVGGTVFLTMNGNRWVGPGHNSVFRDFGGQWWTVYHAVDRNNPVFAGTTDFTKRPVLLDPVDWDDGWPTVRGGRWASDKPMPAPAAQPGQESEYEYTDVRTFDTGDELERFSDEFGGNKLNSRWTWVRQPADSTSFGLVNGTFQFKTQNADIFQDNNTASILTTPAPDRNRYIVETRVKLNVPPDQSVHNYVQAGLVIYGDDNNFIKLVTVSIWNTRQTEFAKEVNAKYGNTVVGPPGEQWTYLRILKRVNQKTGEELYSAYTSIDGKYWERGGTWTHKLGSNAKIGLVSMGGSGFTATFDYVRVYQVEVYD